LFVSFHIRLIYLLVNTAFEVVTVKNGTLVKNETLSSILLWRDTRSIGRIFKHNLYLLVQKNRIK